MPDSHICSSPRLSQLCRPPGSGDGGQWLCLPCTQSPQSSDSLSPWGTEPKARPWWRACPQLHLPDRLVASPRRQEMQLRKRCRQRAVAKMHLRLTSVPFESGRSLLQQCRGGREGTPLRPRDRHSPPHVSHHAPWSLPSTRLSVLPLRTLSCPSSPRWKVVMAQSAGTPAAPRIEPRLLRVATGSP